MINIEPIKHIIQLDFGSSDIRRTVIKQNSNKTHILLISLYKKNDKLEIDPAWDIVISARKPDNTFVVDANNITVADNTIKVTLTKQMLASPGTEKCELAVYKPDGSCFFSDTFFIYVETNVNYGSQLESTDEYGSIVDTLNHIRDMEGDAEKTAVHIHAVSDEVDELKEDIEDTYEDLKESVDTTKGLIEQNRIIESNEKARMEAEEIRERQEEIREQQEEKREESSAKAVSDAEDATKKANDATDNLTSMVQAAVSNHNTSPSAHEDIRSLISDIAAAYPLYSKTINAGYATAYRTQTKGNTNSGDYISTIRNDTASVSNSPQYGSGLAWGRHDTHGYLYVSYNTSAAYIGGGNADRLNWVKQLAFTDHTHSAATTSAAGLMSAADKSKLDGISAGANAYTHPTSAAGAKSSGLYKIATDSTGHVTGTTAVTKADITALGLTADALSTTGGTMTGNISYNMNSSTQIPFKVYGGDANGQGVSVGAGGATIVGAGESAKACESLLSATTEQLWLTSDSNIYFYTNCNTIGSRVGAVLDTSRQFYPNTNNTGSIGTSSYRWNNIYAQQANIVTASGNSYLITERTDTGVKVGFGVGSGGTNHGVYSYKLDNWIVYADANNNVHLNGNATTATTATTATKIGTSTVGSSIKPVYVSSGTVTACGFSVQKGLHSVSITSGGTQTNFSVTFPTAFSTAPTVVFVPRHNSSVTSIEHKLLTTSATGFTGYIKTSGTGTHAVEWIAIGS